MLFLRKAGSFALFIIVVTVSRKNQYKYLTLKDFIYQTVFLGDAATPLLTITVFQGFRMSCACSRVFLEFGNQA